MIGFFIAVLSGALMSVQGVFNTQVTKTTGMWVSNAWVQFSALLLCLVAWLVAGRDSFGRRYAEPLVVVGEHLRPHKIRLSAKHPKGRHKIT